MGILHLKFSGLCGFVPKLSLGDPNNRMRVLLVDARQAHEPHVPVLVVRDGLVNTKPPFRADDGSFTIVEAGIPTLYRYFELDDRDLTVAAASQDNLQILAGSVTSCPPGNLDSFEWVVPIESVSPGSGSIKAACLDPAGDPSVAARVLLREGTLQRSLFAREILSNIILKWDFKPAPAGPTISYQKAIAEEVLYTFDLGNHDGDLITTNFRKPGTPPETIRLLPDKLPGDPMFASVYNMPWDNIKQTKIFVAPRREDTHFVHFYAMSNAPGVNYPWPDGICAQGGPPSLDTPLCPPTRFNPSPQA